MGHPAQENMDGRVITELFEPQFVADNPVAFDQVPEPADPVDRGYDYSEDEIGSVQDELKSLGYL